MTHVGFLYTSTETIYVRVYEARMDLLRAVIIGPSGTPYHDGLFVFDCFFPPKYPNEPPVCSVSMCLCFPKIPILEYYKVYKLILTMFNGYMEFLIRWFITILVAYG